MTNPDGGSLSQLEIISLCGSLHEPLLKAGLITKIQHELAKPSKEVTQEMYDTFIRILENLVFVGTSKFIDMLN
jgi:hypothetical protein